MQLAYLRWWIMHACMIGVNFWSLKSYNTILKKKISPYPQIKIAKTKKENNSGLSKHSYKPINSLTRTNALMCCHVNSRFWQQSIYVLLQQSGSCDCLLLDSKCVMAFRKKKALPSSDANFILRLLEKDLSSDDCHLPMLITERGRWGSIHRPTSSFQTYHCLLTSLQALFRAMETYHCLETYS